MVKKEIEITELLKQLQEIAKDWGCVENKLFLIQDRLRRLEEKDE